MALTRKASIITRILLGLDVVILCPLCFAIFWTSYPDRVVLGMFSSFWEWMPVLSYTAAAPSVCLAHTGPQKAASD